MDREWETLGKWERPGHGEPECGEPPCPPGCGDRDRAACPPTRRETPLVVYFKEVIFLEKLLQH